MMYVKGVGLLLGEKSAEEDRDRSQDTLASF